MFSVSSFTVIVAVQAVSPRAYIIVHTQLTVFLLKSFLCYLLYSLLSDMFCYIS